MREEPPKVIIELHGGQFQNKGAQKMLRKTAAELRTRVPGVRLAADACIGAPQERASLDLSEIAVKRGWMGGRRFRPALLAQQAVPSWVGPGLGRTALREIDGLVDLSGFAFSDQWGPRPIADFARLARFYAVRGRPVILLPQALGPFENPAVRRAFADIARSATVIYARDATSLRFARDAAGAAGDIRLAPDITLTEGRTTEAVAPSGRTVYLVPNIRVWERQTQGAAYVDTFLRIAAGAAAQGADPQFLIHDESGQDIQVAEAVNRRADRPLGIVTESDPWALKERIGRSLAVFGSRFHALVAAISKGVPVVALGWSHKYDELLTDFGAQDFVLAIDAPVEAVDAALACVCDAEANMALRRGLVERLDRQAALSEDMWGDVADALRSAA
jgi:polysaccharide pyruvyl transferase WcaK-like protein